MPRFIASIEARMGSTRLPGKVLMDVGGQPALTRLLRRLRRAAKLDGIVLATTASPDDDVLVDWARAENVTCFRGSEDDVLARVVGAQRMMKSDVVVEVCGDTPLLDPAVIDMAIEAFSANACHVVTTTRRPAFPDGVDAEVFRLSDLEDIARDVTDTAVREHVSLYFYEHPERYRIHDLAAPATWQRPELRLVLDETRDLDLIRAVYARLEPDHGDGFGTAEIIALLDREPEMAALNREPAETPS